MAQGSGVGMIVPEKLSEDNYEQWKRCLKQYLVGHRLWGVVSGKEKEPDKKDKEQHDEWKRKNALALHAIQLSCGTGIYSKFEKAHVSAYHAWTHLAEKAMGPPSDQEPKTQVEDNAYRQYEDLYRAIEEGSLHKTEEILSEHTPLQATLRARISSHKDTPLHIAILCGHIDIAEYLVSKMDPQDLALTNEYSATPLSLVAIWGEVKLARMLVNKNRDLVTMGNDVEDGQIPVIVAALYGQKKMVHHLYKVTPKQKLSPESGKHGVKLLNCLITAEIYDIASMLLKEYPKLGVMPDSHNHYALKILAEKPSAFPSGTKFAFWEKMIYHCVTFHSPWDDDKKRFQNNADNSGDDVVLQIESNEDQLEHEISTIGGFIHKLGWKVLQYFVPEIKYIHDRKLVHDESVKLLRTIFKELQNLSNSELQKMDINGIIYDAIKHGIVEIIREMITYKPEIIWHKDEKGRGIFAHAIVLRQEKIFSLINNLGTRKRIMARRHDAFKNNYLHLAAKLSPPSQLERISGAALQMQRELQWFKEVEKIVQPKLKEERNENNKMPADLFTEEHKDLVKGAEAWMKNTSGSSMIVGTLIAAVMFTTAFTVPGGNREDNGHPPLLDTHPKPFLIFMISNALSLFSSCTSLLMFLGILTARYAEGDFLKSLPTKLMLGLASLFVSVVTMMSSFAAALFLILHERLHWVTIPIIVLSVIPIALFSVLQFPILIEMSIHTFGPPGICDKPKKSFLKKKKS